MNKILCLCGLFCLVMTTGYSQDRWKMNDENGIVWTAAERLPHTDHIEMSGEQLSVVLRYGVQSSGKFELDRSLVWPMLRTLPNNTHASLMQRFTIDVPALLTVNGQSLKNEKVLNISLDGELTVKSEFGTSYLNVGAAKDRAGKPVILMTRKISPSTINPLLCEEYEIKNISDKSISVMIPGFVSDGKTDPAKGLDGSYIFHTAVSGEGTRQVAPGESTIFYVGIQAFPENEKAVQPNFAAEFAARRQYVNQVSSSLVLESPDEVINQMFRFAKIRASESIFKTKNGYMHGPGGESYYAAIWANDQAEYVNPLFPFIGYEKGNLSVMNSFRHFAKYMNPAYEPIPSSIIAEGTSMWNGAGDRGDAAMIAYGAARYSLANGNLQEAKELWPLIQWCLEFCKRKINTDGVVASDSDELEGRFPAGPANLSTSSLYYDALLSAAYLGRDLGLPVPVIKTYQKEAVVLRKAIESYFGSQMGEFKTYRYYDGNDKLRSWICMPLTVGILDRAAGTTEALFSNKLWSDDGLLTQEGSTTYWDRSTLYALRGVFAAGATEKGIAYLKSYSNQRLLGEHVPYAIEAWPEGNQRHLSAESGLYCRIITEGLYGIRPTGLHQFELTPRLPKAWNQTALRNMNAFGEVSDIEIVRVKNGNQVTIKVNGQKKLTKVLPEGETMTVKF